jgi:pyruvate/2-oxoglutarate dehydrogenase complex dihydrolipoamide acyltransferase (E2) component
MRQPAGVSIPLSLPRQLICDYLHFAQKIPSVPVQRRMKLAEVAAARAAAGVRPSWCALFIKAYGFVAAATPQLRRSYLSFPRPRLYEHPVNVVSIAIERQFGDEDAVFFARIRRPERLSLVEIDHRLRRFKEQPIETIGDYRRNLLMFRFPRPLRRLLFWFGLNVWGRKRAALMGTNGITAYSGLGAASLHPLSLLTTTLNYGVIEPDGAVDVRIVYDHRVLDGATIARALAELERVLRHEILAELRYLPPAEAA